MRHHLLRYLCAPASVAVSLVFRMLLHGYLGLAVPYVAFYPAVVCSTMLGGLGPGVLATALGGVAAAYYLVPPSQNPLGLALYLGASLLLVLLTDAQRRARLRADATAQLARERQAQLEAEIERRQQAEAAERAGRQRFETTLASIGDGVIAIDAAGRVTFLNQAAAALTGWTAADAVGQPLESVFVIRNEETGAAMENPALRAVREGRVVGLANHTVLLARDGTRRPIDDSGAPLLSPSGEVAGAVLVFRDVTEARARQEELRERNRMIDAAHDAIITTDAQRRIRFWNTGARELYGWTADEARGRVTHELLRTRVSATTAEQDEQLRVHGQWEGELVHSGSDGREIVCESRQVLLRDAQGEATGILEINRDITERQRAARALRSALAEAEEGRRTLQALMDYIPEGITIADAPDARVRMVSRHGVAIAGRPVETLTSASALEQPATWHLYHPDGTTLARPEELPLTRAVAAGEIVTDEEWIIEQPDGTLIPILCSAAPIRDGAGKVTGALVAWRDLSQRKKLEQKLRESAKLESLGVLAGGIAHDFNNLLTGVLGYASLLAEEAEPGGRLSSYARAITSAAERAARLTQQMLAYSGRGHFLIEPVNVSRYIQEIVALLESSVPKHVELKLSLGENLPLVNADAAQLQQVVMNLVVNGAEAIGPEGGRVHIVTRAEPIDESYIRTLMWDGHLAPGLYVVIEVQDTGCGMDEQTVTRIFDPFFTTKFTGRGLGLAAVQGIVRGHKGAIRVYSAPGAGTTIRVLLPVAGEAADREAPAQRRAARGAGTVLVVDDEEIVRRTAQSALERLGYRVVPATSGREAVDLFAGTAGVVSLVILDMTMPGLSGEETLARLRAIRPDIPVLLSSGFSEMEAIERFGHHRLAGFLQKPYTVATLAEKVRAAAAKGPS